MKLISDSLSEAFIDEITDKTMLTEAKIEAEATDSVTGELLVAVID